MIHPRNAVRTALLLALITLVPASLSAQPQCGLYTLHASFAGYYTSGIPGSASYGVGVGVMTLDGAGKGSSKETVSINGAIMKGAPSNITYTVNSDCTGTITWTYPTFGGLVVHGEFFIADNGKTIYTIGTDDGSLSYGVFTRQY